MRVTQYSSSQYTSSQCLFPGFKLVPRLQQLYSSVEDMDLFLGGIIERPVEDALLGPTFRCLVGDQFKRLKWGDRFWYEEAGQPGSFTPGRSSWPISLVRNCRIVLSKSVRSMSLLFSMPSSSSRSHSRKQHGTHHLRQRREHPRRPAAGLQDP